MSLNTRLAALERRGNPADPEVIIIEGALPDTEPAQAVAGGQVIDRLDGETLDGFAARAWAMARAAGEQVVVVGGLPT